MEIKQFEYKPLAHYSYALISENEMVIVDPERDPMPYYTFAHEHNAKIVAVIETHPHADFISGHVQISEETGATIYNSQKLGADYDHKSFDEGDEIMSIGNAQLRAINTPGHSPDSITIVASEGDRTVLFTGDTLFIGDVGRPDLREKSGNMQSKRKEMAGSMYDTIKNKFKDLPDDAEIYPTHGAGSLCGSNLSSASSSTLGSERMTNWAFSEDDKEKFIDRLLNNQPFIPAYFSHDVEINKSGASNIKGVESKVKLQINTSIEHPLIIDVRDESKFKQGHLRNSINIQAASPTSKFETWLGTLVQPDEEFHIVIDKPSDFKAIAQRVARIGYEHNLIAILTLSEENLIQSDEFDMVEFSKNPDQYTIIDIRNQKEVEEEKYFESAHNIPLPELRDNLEEIPTDKPIVVHCAGGYRSAAGSSIVAKNIQDAKVMDLSDDIKKFQ